MDNSCAVIITDIDNFLVCHPTNSKWQKTWSLPKGIQENNESIKETAIRECFEETSIKINNLDDLVFLGMFNYRKDKTLTIFLYYVDLMPDVKSLKCLSFFEGKKKEEIYPEVDSFRIISFSEENVMSYLNPAQAKIVLSLKNNF